MLVKFKFFLIIIVSIFATTIVGVYMTQRPRDVAISEVPNTQPEELTTVNRIEDITENPERQKYKSIPLESIDSSLRGADPATLALNAFDNVVSDTSRKVEVVYQEPNQAFVTITQPKGSKSLRLLRYRVEMSSFGRSLLASSPPVWEIVWAGSQANCLPGNSHWSNQICQ
jgi:hypothetical protein